MRKSVSVGCVLIAMAVSGCGAGHSPLETSTTNGNAPRTPATASAAGDLDTSAYHGQATCKLLTKEQGARAGLDSSTKAKQYEADECSYRSGTFGYEVSIDKFAPEGLKSVDQKAGKPETIAGQKTLIAPDASLRSCIAFLETNTHEVWTIRHTGKEGEKDSCANLKTFVTEMVTSFKTRPNP